MIKELIGDIFTTNANVICHQVNCIGVMGAGIAVMVKEKISRDSFQEYQKLCFTHGERLLGQVLYTPIVEKEGQVIANCFGQNKTSSYTKCTDYEALKKCLQEVHDTATKLELSVAIPGMIGCGLAGGNWEYVKKEIIAPIFGASDISLTIYYYTQELFEKNAGF